MQMSTVRTRTWLAIAIPVGAILIDQIIKIWVKLTMTIGEEIPIFADWFKLIFVENRGMAFGMELFSKFMLTSIRIVAIAFLIYYLRKIIRNSAFKTGYIVCVAFVLAGAAGNLVDSLIYGEIFSESTPFGVAELVSWGDGYETFMYGHVVDMFQLPLFNWPEWVPFVGGDLFFSPIFNFADACISVSAIVIILFYHNQLELNFKGIDEAADTLEIKDVDNA